MAEQLQLLGSQNPGIVKVGRDLQDHRAQPLTQHHRVQH